MLLLVLLSRAGSAQEAETPDIWLPWEGGAVWRYMNGPHSGSDAVADALDFQPPDAAGRQCETFTSAFWAVAAAGGRATVLPNAVEVDHGNGFRTGYYHLADKQVRTGDEVRAGQRLGRPGCCPDGGSPEDCRATEPHLHFYTSGSGGRRPIAGQHIGGWLVNTDGCLVRPDRRACPGAALISNAPRPETAPEAATRITVALDVSGSMSEPAARGELLRLVAPYLRAASEGEAITVLRFNAHAGVVSSDTENRSITELAGAIASVKPEGMTDLLAGLSLACREMRSRGPEAKQALVLMTDGYHNGSRLRQPERCFAENGWPVFVLGLGRANEGLLERIATATGGDYRAAATIFDPACEMQRVRTLVSGGAHVPCYRFLLRPGERLSIPLAVPPEQAQASLVLTSIPVEDGEEEARVSVTLRMPNGKVLREEGLLAHERQGRGERYAVARPAAGNWEAVISGAHLPAAGVLVDLSFGTTPTAFATGVAPSGSPTPTPAPEADVAATPTETPGATETPTPTPTVSPRPTKLPRPTPTTTPTPTPTATPVVPAAVAP